MFLFFFDFLVIFLILEDKNFKYIFLSIIGLWELTLKTTYFASLDNKHLEN
jgi:hypothetical protein